MEHQKLTTSKQFLSHPKKEDIEAEWTKLLLDWVRICGQVSTSLEQVDFMALLRKYGDMSIQCEPLPEPLDRFLEQKFPKLQLSSKEDVTRKPYITATVILHHCVTRGSGKMVIDICLYLPLEQQTMVRRLCQELRDMEITVANVDTAIAGAFESSSEMLVKHEKQTAAASRSMVSKQNISEALLLPETSFNAINTMKSVLDLARTKVEKSEESSNIQGVAAKPISSSSTYVVIDTVQSNSFVYQYPDETRIYTTNVMEGGINTLTGKTAESYNFQVPLESLNTPDSIPTKSEVIMISQKVVSVEQERSNLTGKCNIIKNTSESSENFYPKAKNLPVDQSEIINTLHYESIITLLPSSFEYLDNNASEVRKFTSGNSEKVFSTGEDMKQKPMAFNSLKICDQSPTTFVSEDIGGIDMLYLKSPFIEQSSVFVNPEQPSSETIVSDTTVSAVFEPKDISKYKIGNITHETSHSITELEKPVTNNAAIIIDTPFKESEYTSKLPVIDYSANTKTPLFQNPVSSLRNSTDDIYNAGDEEVAKELKTEDITIEDTPEFLKKGQEPKTIDESSDDFRQIFNSGPHGNTFLTRKHNNENIKADVIKGNSKGDMESHCANYTDNFGNKSNHKENKHVFFSHKLQEPITRNMPNGRGNGKNGNYWKILSSICAILVILSILIICLIVLFGTGTTLRGDTLNVSPSFISRRHILLDKEEKLRIVQHMKMNPSYNWPSWECSNGLCQKANQSEMGCYESLSRCTLLCSGPQLWPYPNGHKNFGNQIVALAKKRYKYKGSSKTVSKYLDEAFYLFQRNLARLEVTEFMETAPLDLVLKDLYIEIDVESDLDPKLQIDTNESYVLTVQTEDEVKVTIKSPSFQGVRHGLETLSQLTLLDQNTGYLITLTNISIEDAPSFKYRGLMIDTAKNHIPLKDLLRTIDAMSMCKLNTFHWRLSEATFPKLISKFPKLFQDSGFSKDIFYTTNDIELLVKNAGLRGIRVLIEVASPEPVVKSTSLTSDATEENSRLMSDTLCLKMKGSESFFNILGAFYSYIINLSKVEDIIHLSNSLLVFIECFDLMEDRERFLERAQAHLTSANNGTIPKLPVIWYNSNLMSKLGWMWYDFGVQLYEETLPDIALDKYKLIQSTRWDLSCKIVGKEKRMKCRSWQQMYNSDKWRSLETLTLEGGEGLLWMDMVNTNNLDSLLWPRMAALAERFWSDESANQSASAYEYLRLDAQRWRMMIRGVEVQAVWPTWCNYNPRQCFAKINA